MGQGSGVVVSCGVGLRHVSDPTLLWLWCRLAAVALIRPLAWEFPYATGSALKSKTKKTYKMEPNGYFYNRVVMKKKLGSATH